MLSEPISSQLFASPLRPVSCPVRSWRYEAAQGPQLWTAFISRSHPASRIKKGIKCKRAMTLSKKPLNDLRCIENHSKPALWWISERSSLESCQEYHSFHRSFPCTLQRELCRFGRVPFRYTSCASPRLHGYRELSLVPWTSLLYRNLFRGQHPTQKYRKAQKI